MSQTPQSRRAPRNSPERLADSCAGRRHHRAEELLETRPSCPRPRRSPGRRHHRAEELLETCEHGVEVRGRSQTPQSRRAPRNAMASTTAAMAPSRRHHRAEELLETGTSACSTRARSRRHHRAEELLETIRGRPYVPIESQTPQSRRAPRSGSCELARVY